jgi:hypothetical protein
MFSYTLTDTSLLNLLNGQAYRVLRHEKLRIGTPSGIQTQLSYSQLLEYCIGRVGLQPQLGCSPLGFGEAQP